jgi:hypothetical protein
LVVPHLPKLSASHCFVSLGILPVGQQMQF